MPHGWGATTVLERGIAESIDELYAVAFAATIDADLAVAAVHEGIASAQASAPNGVARRVDLIAAVFAAALRHAPTEQPVPAGLLARNQPIDDPRRGEDLVGVAIALSVVLPGWDRAVLQLSLRHDIDPAELAEVLDRVPGTVANDVQAARDHIELLVGSALFAHLMRGQCAELDEAIDGLPPEPPAADLAARVLGHEQGCALCGDRRRGLVPMVNLLASVAIPPAPPSLRNPTPRPRPRRLQLPKTLVTWNRVLAAGIAALVIGLTIGAVVAATARSTDNDGRSTAQTGRLVVSVTALDFGAGRDRQQLSLHNGARGTTTFTVRAAAAWLSATPDRGRLRPGQSAAITVTLDRSAAPEGANHAEVRITSADGDAVVNATAAIERAPVIGTLTATPAQLSSPSCPGPNEATVVVSIVEESGLSVVQLHSRPGGQPETAASMVADKNVLRGTLGPFPAGTVTWWVTATDIHNNSATSPQQTILVSPC